MAAVLERTRRRAPTDRTRATAYARAVVSGKVLAGNLVRLACQKHLDMLARPPEGVRWNADEAEAVCGFFGQLKQYKGRWAGEPFELLDWQAFVVGSIFGWQRYDPLRGKWLRLYREAYISVARKNGKTSAAAGIGLWLLDFDYEHAAEVYFAATKRDQARQAFDTAVHIVQQSDGLRGRVRHLSSVSKLIVPETASVLAPLGRDSDSEHGLNPSAAVIDELHVHRNRDMVDALETAVGAREQPLIVYITTAGVEGASIYVETDDRARRVVQGISRDPALFVYLATLDDDDDWTDPSVYVKANPSLGATIQLDELVAERDKAIATPGRQHAFRRLRLNQRTHSETAWLDLARWDACAGALKRKGRRLIGVDLGGRQDLSAAVEVTWDATGYDIRPHFWMPAELVDEAEERDGVPYRAWAEDGWITLTPGDYRDDARIADDLSRLHAGAIEFDLDVWNSSTLTTPLQDRGYLCVLVQQHAGILSPAVALLEEAVSSGKLTHDGSPVMRWMVANTSLEERRDGARRPVKMDTQRNRRHIDGVSALLDALARVGAAEPPAEETRWGFGAV